MTDPRSPVEEFLFYFKKSRMGVLSVYALIFMALFSFLGPFFISYQPASVDILATFSPPSSKHLMGTDELGRDVLTRLMYGGRITLVVGVVAMLVAVFLGTTVGLVGGLMGGWTDFVLMRITDTFMSIPPFFVMLNILTLFGTTIRNIVIAIGLISWMNVARIIRSEVLKIKELEYVQAARSIGVSRLRLMLIHILPNVIPSVIVASTLGIAWAILVSTALSYLGLGVQPPTPSWGNMLTNSQNYFWVDPMLVVYPGLFIMITVLSANYIGDALRDVLNPKSRDYHLQ